VDSTTIVLIPRWLDSAQHRRRKAGGNASSASGLANPLQRFLKSADIAAPEIRNP
jgi:hypothetical protein